MSRAHDSVLCKSLKRICIRNAQMPVAEASKSAPVGWNIYATRLRDLHWEQEVTFKVKTSAPPKRTTAILSKSKTRDPLKRTAEFILGKQTRQTFPGELSAHHLPPQFYFYAVGNSPLVRLPYPEVCRFSSSQCYKLTTSSSNTSTFFWRERWHGVSMPRWFDSNLASLNSL